MNACRALTILLVLTSLTTARAENKAAARASFASGTSHYDLAEYEPALTDFKEAYRNFPDPNFLFNIAQCHRQLGQNDDAIRFYRTYLSKVPQAPNQREIRAMITKLEKLSAEQRAAAPPPVVTPAPVVAAPPVVTPAPPVAVVPAPVVVVAAAPAPREKPLYKRWWLWTAVGGAVAIGLGVGLGVGLSHADNATASSSFGTVHPF